MAPHFRIPLTVAAGAESRVEDLDLFALLNHSGGPVPASLRLAARNGRGEPVPVQWLPSSAPSAVRGQRRGSLFLGPTVDAHVELLVQAGNEKAVEEVRIKESPDALEITVEGKPFATYRYKDSEVPRPYFHPLIGPTGQTITQMGEVPGKKEKHFHHTALWIAHQNFQATGDAPLDNWQIGKKNSTRIEHVKFEVVESGPLAGRFVEKLHWLNLKGDKVLLTETRTVTVPKRPEERRVLDFSLQYKAGDAAVTWLKTPYHLLAVRVPDAMLPAQGGTILNAKGMKSPPDGTPANWIDVSGKLADAEQGVALLDHPQNFRHPTPCLQFAGQTIGLTLTHKEPHTIPPGETLSLRFRVLVHAGDAERGKVAEEFDGYARMAKVRIGGPEILPS